MATTTTQPTERQLREQAVDVIVTVNGGKDTSHSVLRGGGLVGMESAGTRPPKNVPVEFVDWPFTKPNIPLSERWEQHLSVVKQERPRYAVAPDVDGISLSDALDYADQLSEYARTVIVVPKDVHPSAVPDEYRVGMPCQERFGPAPWQWTDYQDCKEVHLLGGSPSKHHEIRKYFVSVCSLDTASVVRAAYLGKAWTTERWMELNEGFYTALESSVKNVGKSWNGDDWTISRRWLYRKPVSEYDDIGFPTDDLLDPDDDLPFPGREWIIEHGMAEYHKRVYERGRQN